MALAFENELVLAMVLDQKRRLFETIGYDELGENDEQEVTAKYKETLKKMDYINNLWGIKSKLFRQMLSKGVARNSEEIEAYNTICAAINEVVKLNELNAEGVYLLNHIRSVHKYAIGELKHSYHFLQKNLEHFANNSSFRTQEPQKFISVLTNAVYIADRLGRHNEALQLLSQLKEVSRNIDLSPDLEMKVFTTQESIQLSLELRMGQAGEIVKRKSLIKEKLQLYQDKINPARKAFIQYKLALACFVNEDYSDCLKMLDEILQESLVHNNEELKTFSYVLELLCFIELQKEELLAYRLKSFERHVKKNSRFERVEQAVLVFFRAWIKSGNKLDRLDELEKLNRSLGEMEREGQSSDSILEFFDFLAWTKAKMGEKPMEVCIKERYNANMRTAS